MLNHPRFSKCERCGKDFENIARGGSPRFCSRSCWRVAVSANTLEERYWSKVVKGPDCWLWTGSMSSKGYGRISAERRHVTASRVAYSLEYGAFDERLHVLHRCDNPSCVRPDHLFLGTQVDNMADMNSKNRHGRSGAGENVRKGKSHPFAKIDESCAKQIRERHKSGITMKELASSFGLNVPSIWRIIHRKTWKHVA